jgi:BirA family biotin operon repressor/biotin-[acetyl-CoA-carboxylase] ligase
VAGRQSRGRGRLDRTWLSADGGLYFTVVVRPAMPPFLSPRVSFAASLTLVKVLRKMFDIPARVKWPNDVLVEGRKIAGMLSEMEAETDRLSYVNIGIGLNVNNDPTLKEPTAASLAILLGGQVSRKAVLMRFLTDFKECVGQLPLDNIISEWKEYTSTLNRHVKVVTFQETVEGEAVDVDGDGALIVKMHDNTTRRIVYGDCFYA